MGRKHVKTDPAPRGQVKPDPVPKATAFADAYPRLYWELSSRKWGDGKVDRLPSCLSIFHQDGQIKGCLKDRDMKKVAFLTAATIDLLFAALNEALQKGDLDWRIDRFAAADTPKSS